MPHDYAWDTILGEIDHRSWTEEAFTLVETVYPCSSMQEGIYMARETTGRNLYRIHALFEMRPSTTVERLEAAWQALVLRHENLRTIFVPTTDSSLSRLLDAVVFKTVRATLELVVCQDYAAVLAMYQESCVNPKDFPKGPPHRLLAYNTADGRKFCAFDQSHMISDGTSLVNMVTELGALAEGFTLDVALGYSKFTKHTQDADETLEYWKSYLSGASRCNFPPLWLGSQLKEIRATQSCEVIAFPFLRHQELSAFCTKLETTVSTVVQAAWALLLRTYTGSEEAVFGLTCSGREIPLDGVETICGPLVNLIVRRANLAEQSLKGLIETIQNDFADSMPFQSAPFMRVRKLVETAETKLFNTIMTVQYAPALVDESSQLPFRLIDNYNASDFDLSVQVMYSETATKMQLTYSTALIPASAAERVTKTFNCIIESFLDAVDMDIQVGRLNVISPSDKQAIDRWNRETMNGLQIPLPKATVHGLIEEAAIRHPQALAIYFSGGNVTYEDLDYMSSCLADQLLRSLDPEQRFIPLLFEKSALYSISLLAVMKCGRAFVPVDINNPMDRIQRIFEQLGITPSFGLVICSAAQSEQLQRTCCEVLVPSMEELRAESTDDNVSTFFPVVYPNQPAYVIFTSGSTGNPKGVVVSHGAYAHAARTHAGGIGIGPESRVLQFASYAFDTSMEDHLTTFIVGACLCVPTETERETALLDFINQSLSNWLHITPSMADLIPPDSVLSLKTMVLGGEPMTIRNVTQWAIPGRRLIQVYGPSECSVTSTINSDVSINRDPTDIGTTFAGCATWVTDPNNPEILYPIGAVGELLVEGPILAEGYLGQISDTKSSFLTYVPWAPVMRLYRTGDLVQYDEEGKLHFVGRADSRVKIRGQRIECGEIESQLVMQSSVLHTVVVAPKSGPAADHLIAVVSLKTSEESRQPQEPSNDIQLLEDSKMIEAGKTLHDWLADRLPAYMIPDLFVLVHHLPMNRSRKLDRKQAERYLENMSEESYRRLVGQMDGPDEDRAATEMERLLKSVWCYVLNVPEDSVKWNTSWFSSGGDSISAMMLSSELRKQSINVAAADVLRLRTIERIAVRIQETISNTLDAKFQNVDLIGAIPDVSWELSPIQQLSFQVFPEGDNLDQQTMVVRSTLNLSKATIVAALDVLVKAHPMLMARFTKVSDVSTTMWMQHYLSAAQVGKAYILRFHPDGNALYKLERIAETQRTIDIVKGPIIGVNVFQSATSTTISFSVQHLAIDMVSWRIIFQELEDYIAKGQTIQPEPVSFQSWCQVQKIYSQSIQPSRALPGPGFKVDLGYWGMEGTPNLFKDTITARFGIEPAEMSNLLNAGDRLGYDHVEMLAAVVLTSFHKIFPARDSPAIFVEGHGREPPSQVIDLSRTVGWFTTFAPLAIRVDHDNASGVKVLEETKRFREATPAKGFDYFTSRFLQPEGITAYRERHAPAEIVMNFLGAYQQLERESSTFKRCDDAELLEGLSQLRRDQRKDSERYSFITIVAAVEHGSLSVEVEWNRNMNFQNELGLWPSKIKDSLLGLIKDLTSPVPHQIGTAPQRPTCFGSKKDKAFAEVKRLGLNPDQVESIYPCSPMQEGLMASLLRSSGTSSAYNQTFLLKVTPSKGRTVDSAHLAETWRHIVRKHAILRTLFVEDEAGSHAQIVLRNIDPTVITKDSVSDVETRSTLFDSENEQLASPLSGVPLHRFMICQTTDASTYILLTKSHLLTDGRSTQILIRDLISGCDGVVETYWNPQHQYLDYIRYVSNQNADLVVGYWAAYLDGAATCNFPKLNYTVDAGITPSHSTAILQLHHRETGIQQFCRTHELTASNVFQLAWAMVLRVYLNSEDVLYGFLSSGRDLPIDGIEEAVGPVANMLPIRSVLSRDVKVLEAIKNIQAAYIDHLPQQTISLARMLHAGRSGNQTPSFNTILNIQKSEATRQEERTVVELVKGTDTTEYGLALTITDTESGYEVCLEYERNLISHQAATSVVAAFATAVKNVIATPDRLVGEIDLVNDETRQQIQRWDRNEVQTKAQCVHHLFQTTANSVPDKEAIFAWDGQMTYGELEMVTNKLARALIGFSVQPEEIVPLCFEKSLWGIVAMLSVVKAGATFVHIDPSSPAARKEQIIKITAPRVAMASVRHQETMESLVAQTLVIGEETLSSFATDNVGSRDSSPIVGPSNAIYVIFTSGSTGEPKGVVIEHQNFCSAMSANATWLQILPPARILQFSSFVFDACMEEILTALVTGACVCVPSDDDRMSPEGLTSFIQNAHVNWVALTPSLLQTLDPNALVPPLTFITVHAEPMNASLTKLWSSRVRMRPSYGPTECTVTSTVGSDFTESSDPSNIGWPVGCHGRITDPDDPQRLVPVGAVGELVLEGPILGRGYLNRPVETAKSFPYIQDWFSKGSKRVYRTGDLVRYADDGSLRILGRRDAQIKVRGQRVELGEVKSQVDLAPLVLHSLVLQPTSGLLRHRLVAVLSLTQSAHAPESAMGSGKIRLVNPHEAVGVEGPSISEALQQIRSFVTARLPSYMIPDTWFVVQDVPTLASLKLDRKQVSGWLESIDEPTLLSARQLMSNSTGSGPHTDSQAEKAVRAIWSQVLAIPGDLMDTSDHFIALGGDSISAMHVSRLLTKSGIAIKTQDVLRSNSIRELASIIEAREPQGSVSTKSQPVIMSGPSKIPTIQDILSEYQFTPTNGTKILSIHPGTPFQSRTTSALYKSSWKPYIYNLFAEIRGYESLEHKPDVLRLRKAWYETVARHEILRIAILLSKDGQDAYQVVLDRFATDCEVIDAPSEKEAFDTSIKKTKQIKASLAETSTPPLWLTLFVTPTKQIFMHLVMGHMLIDNVSLAHMYHDWDRAYRGDSSLQPSQQLPQFRDYVRHVQSRDYQASADFWSQRLQGVQPTTLPPTNTSPCNSLSLDEDISNITFEINVDARMHMYCRSMRVTTSTLLQFAWGVMLSCLTGQDSVCFGHLVSDRDIDMENVDEVVGPMLSVLVTDVALGNSAQNEHLVEEVIQRLQRDNTASMAHKVFDLSAIEHQRGLKPPSRPLFNTIVNYRKVRRSGPEPIMKLRRILEQDAYEQQILLSFNDVVETTSLVAALTFHHTIHSAESVQQMADTYQHVITLLISGECRTIKELLSCVGVGGAASA